MDVRHVSTDVLLRFLKEAGCLNRHADENTDFAHLLNAYKLWCKRNKHKYYAHYSIGGLEFKWFDTGVNYPVVPPGAGNYAVCAVDWLKLPFAHAEMLRGYCDIEDEEEFEEEKVIDNYKPKDDKMSEKNTELFEAAKLGAKLAIANEAGEVALQFVEKLFPQLDLKDSDQRALGKVVAAFALSYAAELSGQDNSDKIHTICQLVVTSATQELTQEKLKTLKPVLNKLTKLANKLPEA